MATGTPDEAVTPSGKPTKAGRDNKPPKDRKKIKDDSVVGAVGDGKNGALLRQMASDLAMVSANLNRLQTDVDALKGICGPTVTDGKKKPKATTFSGTDTTSRSGDLLASLTDTPGTVVALVIPSAATDGSADTAFVCTPDQDILSAVDSAHVAKLGYAFSSIPKVSLI